MWGAHCRTNSARGSGSLGCVRICAWAEPRRRRKVAIAAMQERRSMMALHSDLIGSDFLSRGKHERDCMHGGRAVIGEGAGSRQIVGRSSDGGTREQEGEGEDEAEGPHQSVSKITRQASFAGQLDTQRLFPDICTKSGKWFRRRKNC